jgi:hypothetical protein
MPRNMQAFLLAQPGDDGSLVLRPMKAWLHQHPDLFECQIQFDLKPVA